MSTSFVAFPTRCHRRETCAGGLQWPQSPGRGWGRRQNTARAASRWTRGWMKWQCVKTNSTPSVHIKIAGLKWMVIPLKMVLIGIDPYPNAGKRLEHVEETWEDHGKTMRPYRRMLEHIGIFMGTGRFSSMIGIPIRLKGTHKAIYENHQTTEVLNILEQYLLGRWLRLKPTIISHGPVWVKSQNRVDFSIAYHICFGLFWIVLGYVHVHKQQLFSVGWKEGVNWSDHSGGKQ